MLSSSSPNYGGYTRSRADIDREYGNQSTTNAYGRFLGQQRFNRGRSDARREFGRQYAPERSQWGRRGLAGGGINSGAMQESMTRFVGDFARDDMRANQDQVAANQAYDLQQANLDEWRQQGYRDIEAQKANDIAWTAQNLMQLRELLGGI